MDNNGRLRFQLEESPRLHEMPVHPMLASSSSDDDDDDEDVSSSVVSSLSRDDSLLLQQQQQHQMMTASTPVHNSHLNPCWHHHGQFESSPPKVIIIPLKSTTDKSTSFQVPAWLVDVGANAPSPSLSSSPSKSSSSSTLDWQQTIPSPTTTVLDSTVIYNYNNDNKMAQPPFQVSRKVARSTTATNQDIFRTTPTPNSTTVVGAARPETIRPAVTLLETLDHHPSPLHGLRGKEVNTMLDYYSTAVPPFPQDEYDFAYRHDESPSSSPSSARLSVPGWTISCRTPAARSIRESPTSRDDYDKAQRMDSIVEREQPQHDSIIPSTPPTGYPPVSMMMWSSPSYIHRPTTRDIGKDFLLSGVVVGGSKSSFYTEPTSSSSTGDLGDGHVVNASIRNKSTMLLLVGRQQQQPQPLPPAPTTTVPTTNTANPSSSAPVPINRRSLLHRRNSLQNLWRHLSWKSKRSSVSTSHRRRSSMTSDGGGAFTISAAAPDDDNVKVHTGCFS